VIIDKSLITKRLQHRYRNLASQLETNFRW